MTDILAFGAEPAAARASCVFVHGRGQMPEDMIDLVLRRLETPGVAFLLPRADGRSWYAAKAIDPVTAETEAALGASLDVVGAAVAQARAAAPERPVLLAGFSQGACLALEWAFREGPWPGALAVLTGCRVGAYDARPAAPVAGLPVYASCGDGDPWIPLDAFTAALRVAGTGGARLRADIFPRRPHEVSSPEVGVLDAMLGDLAAGRPAFGAA